jgi:hypothetical protein
MSTSIFMTAALLTAVAPVGAQESPQRGDSWTRSLADRNQRGTLQDALQYVRGDSGKWQDESQLVIAPPIGQKPAKLPLDDWADQLLKGPVQLTSNGDTWLLIRTRQMDDHDRVWVDRVERQGQQFNIVLHEAIWQGKYFKNFTYYQLMAINLGRLAAGKYEVKCLFDPLAFKAFEGTGQPKDNWPKDERPTDQKPLELRASFSVSPK